MAFTLCTSGAATIKAGAQVNASLLGDSTAMDEFSTEVEGTINTITRRDWTTDFASVGANFKPILSDTASDMIAMKMIGYDMSGYNKTLNATTMLDLLNNNSTRNIEILRLKEHQEKM